MLALNVPDRVLGKENILREERMEPNCIQFKVSMPFEIEQDGNAYVSSCPPLDVFSQGDTEEEAMENLGEAVNMFLESCIRRQTLEKVLSERGFEMVAEPNRPQLQYSEDEQSIEIPISLVAHDQAYAA